MESAIQVLEQMNDYQRQVNADMIRHLQGLDINNERVAKLMSHIVNAHQIWLDRIQDREMGVKVFELRPYADLVLQGEKNHADTVDVLAGRKLDEAMNYVNSQGQHFRNTISDMLLHVFNHSSYHRGQINQLLVQEGKPAMISDFIVYNRTPIL